MGRDDRSPSDTWPAAAEVVVVGGGLAGTCCAHLLAASGARVVLLEAGEEVGGGASGSGAGFVLTGLVEHPHRLAASLGDDTTRALLAWGRAGTDLLARIAPVRRDGVCWVALEARETADVAASAETLARLGVPVEDVDPATLGLAEAVAGLRVVGDGILPSGTVAAVARAAEDAGARVVTGCRVDAVTDDGDGLVVHAGPRRLRAEVVVYAGGHALAAVDPTFEDKVFPVREEALFAAGSGPSQPVRAGWGYTFFRSVEGGGVLAGGCRWASPSMGVGACTTESDPKVQGRIEAALRRHLPAAGTVQRRWAWLDTYTCDGLPIVGPLPGSVRRIACTGFCGNDAGLAPAAAAAVAEGLLGRGQPDIPRCLAASRFV